MFFIRQGATHKVVLGPAVAVGDGFTPVTNLDVATADEAEAILHDNGTVVDISGYTWAAIAVADGYYHLTLQAAISGTVGHLTIVINDDSLLLPLRADFTVLDTAPYDANFKDAATGPALATDVTTAHSTTDGLIGGLNDFDGTGATLHSDYDAAKTAAQVGDLMGLSADAITAAKIADDAISSEHLNTGALTADAFAADAIIAATFATGALTADAFAADALVAATFATGAFTADVFAADALVAATFATDSITADALAADAVAEIAGTVAQDVAQVVNRTAGAVYFVATDGNDGSDGLTPDTAKLTPKTVIEAASANDVVILGPGTFAMGDNVITEPDGITVLGAGMGRTKLTSTAKTYGAGAKGAILKPGSNSWNEGFTVKGLNDDGSYQACFGSYEDAPASQSAFTDAVLKNVRGIADTDCLQIIHDTACSLIGINLILESKFDTVKINGSSDHAVDLYNPSITVTGPSSAGATTANSVNVWSGTVRLFNPVVYSTNDNLLASSIMVAGGTVLAMNPTLYTDAGGGSEYDLYRIGGTLLVVGGNYDRSKTSGTITEISSAESAVVANKLDHLAAVAESDDPVDNSILAKMASTDGDWSKFVDTTDSLQSIRDSVALASVCTEARLAVLTALTSAAAAKLALSAAGIVTGAVEAGTLSTTQMTTDLSEATDDHYIGAVVVWTSGVLAGQRSDITDYTGADGLLTFTAVTEAPSATDTFVIL